MVDFSKPGCRFWASDGTYRVGIFTVDFLSYAVRQNVQSCTFNHQKGGTLKGSFLFLEMNST